MVGTDTPVLHLNLPMDELKQLAANDIARGEPVWFGCDAKKLFSRKFTYSSTDMFDMEGAYGTGRYLNKKERLEFGQSLMTHAMLLTGVHVPGSGTRKVTTGPKSKSKDSGSSSDSDSDSDSSSSGEAIDASKITKWRIQNSWGTRLGNEGYLTATDGWMDEFTYQIVVDRSRLPEKAKIALETEPVVLPPWDILRSCLISSEVDDDDKEW